jgi:hypothetical protein
MALMPLAPVFAKGKKQKGKQTTSKKKSSKAKQSAGKKGSAKKSSKASKNNKTTAKKAVATKKTKAVKEMSEGSNAEEAYAQGSGKDTSKPDVVVLYASFKPTLRNAAKLNFTAATPVIDSTRIPLTYKVPAQNLFFSYQPVPIKPLALYVDSGAKWQNNQYVKVGFGNYATPYLEAGAAFGDGINNITTVHAKFTSSKGNRDFQQFSKAGIEALGSYTNKKNQQWNAKLFYSNSTQYQYGYEPNNLIFNKEQLKQQFNTVGFNLGLKNKQATNYGILYNPSIGVNYFFDARNGKELNFIAKAPVNKSFSNMFALDLNVVADITNYQTPIQTINNNLFYVAPTVQFKTPNLKLNFGVLAGWDNQTNSLLPNITAEAKINGEKFVLQAGWVGYYQKNTYQSLSSINPFLQQPTALNNTRIHEQYAGFKGSAGNHFTYNAKLSFLKMIGQPLFTNDLVDGKSFIVFNEPDLQAIRIHGEVGYTMQEKFSFLASVNINQFTKISTLDKAYGLTPLELNGILRWKLLKDLYFKSDVFFWDGAQYRNKSLTSQKLNAAMDLNAGVEYSLMPKLNLWLQFNNLLNSKYQRWSQYEVLGLNVLGGVVYSFK